MEKRLRSIALVLFSICCAVGFSTSVSAETLNMTTDMLASDVQDFIDDATEDVIIDGHGEYVITDGGISVGGNKSVTIQNVTMDGLIGEVGVDADPFEEILVSVSTTGNVVIDNVTFINFDEKAIYVDAVKSLTVTNSVFECDGTINIGNNDYGDNPDKDFMYRSASGIDMNLGNNAKTIDIESIHISNNTFRNVLVVDDPAVQAESTAGAIKIKVKDKANLVIIGTITIEENSFENNVRDLVIGTNNPTSGTDPVDTANLEILLVNNEKMNVGNFSTADKEVEALEGNYKLNYATDKKLELNDNLYYIVNDNNYNDFLDDEDIVNTIIDDADIKGITFNVDGVSFDISSAKLESTDLDAALNDFDFQITEDTTIEALKPYQGENAFFVSFSGSELFDNGITLNTSLGESFSENLYLYYYDEENGLQLVSKSDATSSDVSLSFSKSGNYVVSSTDLLGSASSETVADVPEEVPNVPQTFDALGIYAGLGFISVAGIAGAVIYLKRKNA